MEARTAMLQRAVGCLYGQFIGDALGCRYEFKPEEDTQAKMKKDMDANGHLPMLGGGPFKLPKGVVTDDSEMAMSLLASMIRVKDFDEADVGAAYCRWALTNPPDIGLTCNSALNPDVKTCPGIASSDWHHTLSVDEKRALVEGIHTNVAKFNQNSLSNGSLMRQSVIPVFYGKHEFQKVQDAVVADTKMTHYQTTAAEASVAYARAIHMTINGASPLEAYGVCLQHAEDPLIHDLIDDSQRKPLLIKRPDRIGFLGVALQCAFHELTNATSFEEGLVRTIGRGGDTDTNGAIAGALLGARFGIEGIPEDWRECVRTAALRLKGENGIVSFDELVKAVEERYR